MHRDVSHLEPPELAKRDPGLDFRDFFEGEYRRLAKALFLMTGDPLEAEELAQEALVRVFERWDQVRQIDSRPVPSTQTNPEASDSTRTENRRCGRPSREEVGAFPMRIGLVRAL